MGIIFFIFIIVVHQKYEFIRNNKIQFSGYDNFNSHMAIKTFVHSVGKL